MADPLARPEPLIRRVYAYAAYRLGDGPDAEDATSDTFERALRYRSSYDQRKGDPIAWLLGIARRCVDDVLAGRRPSAELVDEHAAPGDLEPETIRSLAVRGAVQTHNNQTQKQNTHQNNTNQTTHQNAELLGERTNTVEVALHRAVGRLRVALADEAPRGKAAGSTRPASL